MADLVFIGGSAKYLHQSIDSPASTDTVKGVVIDAGITIRPLPLFSLGVVGTNQTNLETSLVPQSVGGGVAVNAAQGLSLFGDAVLERIYADSTRGKALSIMGGGEYLAPTFGVRAGGGRDGFNKNGYLSGGVSVVSNIGALEGCVRQDVSGDRKALTIGISGRLFVPSP
jgi:hypothetical protein